MTGCRPPGRWRRRSGWPGRPWSGAYEELTAAGFLVARPGGATYVEQGAAAAARAGAFGVAGAEHQAWALRQRGSARKRPVWLARGHPRDRTGKVQPGRGGNVRGGGGRHPFGPDLDEDGQDRLRSAARAGRPGTDRRTGLGASHAAGRVARPGRPRTCATNSAATCAASAGWRSTRRTSSCSRASAPRSGRSRSSAGWPGSRSRSRIPATPRPGSPWARRAR